MKLVKLFEGTLFECQMIQNLLENEGIDSDLNNEITGTRGGNIFRPAGGVVVIVTDNKFERAKRIVKEYEESCKE